MMMRKYWDRDVSFYSKAWSSQAKKMLSKKELEFINYYLRRQGYPKKVLDIGVGTGRILENYFFELPLESKIYGVDFSNSMVDFCKKKFAVKKNFGGIKMLDISKRRIDFGEKFDFVSAIRVLKYNRNWTKIVGNISQIIKGNGVFIFSMPNRDSISYFWRAGLPIIYSTKKEIEKLLANLGFEILEIKTFTRIPDFFYKHSTNFLFTGLLVYFEKILAFFLGKSFLGRIIFVAAFKRGKN